MGRVLSSGHRPDDVAILVNDGHGVFERMPISLLPIVQNFHLKGNESWEGQSWGNSRTGYIYPIDLDGNGVASFLVQMFLSPNRWPMERGDFNRGVLYTISPVKPYKLVPGPAKLSDTECLFSFGEQVEPGILADKGIKTQRFGAIDYRYYPSTDTYLGLRANRVLLYRPSLKDELVDLGGLYQYLPAARSSGC